MTPRVGIDLDNTLVCYNAVFERLARERGIQLGDAPVNKQNIRDAVRAAAGNDVWTELQGLAYGPKMGGALLMPGAKGFLTWARAHGIALFVVSHKTRRSAAGGHDLHAPAVEWMRSHAFFSPDGFGLEFGKHVFLEETREAKFGRIADLGLTHFIDDLEEFLTDPAFPSGVERLHYAPQGGPAAQGMRNFGTWRGIHDHFEQKMACS